MADDQQRPVWSKRLRRMIQESFNFIGAAASHHRERVAVRAVPIRDGDHRIVYRFGVRGELLPEDLVEDFRDILGRARSVLDIAMFGAATAVANPPLTDRQKHATYFPIAGTREQWNSAAGQPHMRALTEQQRGALREMQPFVTGNQVIAEFARIHNDDKHQRPLELFVIPDPEFVMLFRHLDPSPDETHEFWVDYVTPLPPVAQRVEFVEYRSVDAIRSAGVEDVPIALAVAVDGEWRDVQHLLWDLMEFVVRGASILDNGDTELADSMQSYFGSERALLDAFKKMMTTGDPAAEREWKSLAGFDEDDPGSATHDTLPKPWTYGRQPTRSTRTR